MVRKKPIRSVKRNTIRFVDQEEERCPPDIEFHWAKAATVPLSGSKTPAITYYNKIFIGHIDSNINSFIVKHFRRRIANFCLPMSRKEVDLPADIEEVHIPNPSVYNKRNPFPKYTDYKGLFENISFLWFRESVRLDVYQSVWRSDKLDFTMDYYAHLYEATFSPKFSDKIDMVKLGMLLCRRCFPRLNRKKLYHCINEAIKTPVMLPECAAQKNLYIDYYSKVATRPYVEDVILEGRRTSLLINDKEIRHQMEEIFFTQNKFQVFGSRREEQLNPIGASISPNDRILPKMDHISWETFNSTIFPCSILIYNIADSEGERIEARYVVNMLIIKLLLMGQEERKKFQKVHGAHTVIILSTLCTWGKTPVHEYVELTNTPLFDDFFNKRVPPNDFRDIYDLESYFMDLAVQFRDMLRIIVIGCGIIYGQDGIVFTPETERMAKHLMCSLFHYDFPLVLGRGVNHMLFISIKDLIGIIHNLIVFCPRDKHYFIACELAMGSLHALMQTLARNFCNRNKVVHYDAIELITSFGDIDSLFLSRFGTDTFLFPRLISECGFPVDQLWKVGLVQAVSDCMKTYKAKHPRILVLGSHLVRSKIAKILGKIFNIPVLTLQLCVKRFLKRMESVVIDLNENKLRKIVIKIVKSRKITLEKLRKRIKILKKLQLRKQVKNEKANLKMQKQLYLKEFDRENPVFKKCGILKKYSYLPKYKKNRDHCTRGVISEEETSRSLEATPASKILTIIGNNIRCFLPLSSPKVTDLNDLKRENSQIAVKEILKLENFEEEETIVYESDLKQEEVNDSVTILKNDKYYYFTFTPSSDISKTHTNPDNENFPEEKINSTKSSKVKNRIITKPHMTKQPLDGLVVEDYLTMDGDREYEKGIPSDESLKWLDDTTTLDKVEIREYSNVNEEFYSFSSAGYLTGCSEKMRDLWNSHRSSTQEKSWSNIMEENREGRREDLPRTCDASVSEESISPSKKCSEIISEIEDCEKLDHNIYSCMIKDNRVGASSNSKHSDIIRTTKSCVSKDHSTFVSQRYLLEEFLLYFSRFIRQNETPRHSSKQRAISSEMCPSENPRLKKLPPLRISTRHIFEKPKLRHQINKKFANLIFKIFPGLKNEKKKKKYFFIKAGVPPGITVHGFPVIYFLKKECSNMNTLDELQRLGIFGPSPIRCRSSSPPEPSHRDPVLPPVTTAKICRKIPVRKRNSRLSRRSTKVRNILNKVEKLLIRLYGKRPLILKKRRKRRACRWNMAGRKKMARRKRMTSRRRTTRQRKAARRRKKWRRYRKRMMKIMHVIEITRRIKCLSIVLRRLMRKKLKRKSKKSIKMRKRIMSDRKIILHQMAKLVKYLKHECRKKKRSKIPTKFYSIANQCKLERQTEKIGWEKVKKNVVRVSPADLPSKFKISYDFHRMMSSLLETKYENMDTLCYTPNVFYKCEVYGKMRVFEETKHPFIYFADGLLEDLRCCVAYAGVEYEESSDSSDVYDLEWDNFSLQELLYVELLLNDEEENRKYLGLTSVVTEMLIKDVNDAIKKQTEMFCNFKTSIFLDSLLKRPCLKKNSRLIRQDKLEKILKRTLNSFCLGELVYVWKNLDVAEKAIHSDVIKLSIVGIMLDEKKKHVNTFVNRFLSVTALGHKESLIYTLVRKKIVDHLFLMPDLMPPLRCQKCGILDEYSAFTNPRIAFILLKIAKDIICRLFNQLGEFITVALRKRIKNMKNGNFKKKRFDEHLYTLFSRKYTLLKELFCMMPHRKKRSRTTSKLVRSFFQYGNISIPIRYYSKGSMIEKQKLSRIVENHFSKRKGVSSFIDIMIDSQTPKDEPRKVSSNRPRTLFSYRNYKNMVQQQKRFQLLCRKIQAIKNRPSRFKSEYRFFRKVLKSHYHIKRPKKEETRTRRVELKRIIANKDLDRSICRLLSKIRTSERFSGKEGKEVFNILKYARPLKSIKKCTKARKMSSQVRQHSSRTRERLVSFDLHSNQLASSHKNSYTEYLWLQKLVAKVIFKLKNRPFLRTVEIALKRLVELITKKEPKPRAPSIQRKRTSKKRLSIRKNIPRLGKKLPNESIKPGLSNEHKPSFSNLSLLLINQITTKLKSMLIERLNSESPVDFNINTLSTIVCDTIKELVNGVIMKKLLGNIIISPKRNERLSLSYFKSQTMIFPFLCTKKLSKVYDPDDWPSSFITKKCDLFGPCEEYEKATGSFSVAIDDVSSKENLAAPDFPQSEIINSIIGKQEESILSIAPASQFSVSDRKKRRSRNKTKGLGGRSYIRNVNTPQWSKIKNERKICIGQGRKRMEIEVRLSAETHKKKEIDDSIKGYRKHLKSVLKKKMIYTSDISKKDKHKKKRPRKIHKKEHNRFDIFSTVLTHSCKHLLLSQRIYKEYKNRLNMVKGLDKLLKEMTKAVEERTSGRKTQSRPTAQLRLSTTLHSIANNFVRTTIQNDSSRTMRSIQHDFPRTTSSIQDDSPRRMPSMKHNFPRTTRPKQNDFSRAMSSVQYVKRTDPFLPSALKVIKPLGGLPKSFQIVTPFIEEKWRNDLLSKEPYNKTRKLSYDKVKCYTKKGNLENKCINIENEKKFFNSYIKSRKMADLDYNSERSTCVKKKNDDNKKKRIVLLRQIIRNLNVLKEIEMRRLLKWTTEKRDKIISISGSKCQFKTNKILLDLFATDIIKLLKSYFKVPKKLRPPKRTPKSNNSFIQTKKFPSNKSFIQSKTFPSNKSFIQSKKLTSNKSFIQSKKLTSNKSFIQSKKLTSNKSFIQSKKFPSNKSFIQSQKFPSNKSFIQSKKFPSNKSFIQSQKFPSNKSFIQSQKFTSSKSFIQSRKKSSIEKSIQSKVLLKCKTGRILVTRNTRVYRGTVRTGNAISPFPKETRTLAVSPKLQDLRIENSSTRLSRYRRLNYLKRLIKRQCSEECKKSRFLSALLKKEKRTEKLLNNVDKAYDVIKEVEDKRKQKEMTVQLIFRRQKLNRRLRSIARKRRSFLHDMKFRKTQKILLDLYNAYRSFIDKLPMNRKAFPFFIGTKDDDVRSLLSAEGNQPNNKRRNGKNERILRKYPLYYYHVRREKCRCPKPKKYLHPMKSIKQPDSWDSEERDGACESFLTKSFLMGKTHHDKNKRKSRREKRKGRKKSRKSKSSRQTMQRPLNSVMLSPEEEQKKIKLERILTKNKRRSFLVDEFVKSREKHLKPPEQTYPSMFYHLGIYFKIKKALHTNGRMKTFFLAGLMREMLTEVTFSGLTGYILLGFPETDVEAAVMFSTPSIHCKCRLRLNNAGRSMQSLVQTKIKSCICDENQCKCNPLVEIDRSLFPNSIIVPVKYAKSIPDETSKQITKSIKRCPRNTIKSKWKKQQKMKENFRVNYSTAAYFFENCGLSPIYFPFEEKDEENREVFIETMQKIVDTIEGPNHGMSKYNPVKSVLKRKPADHNAKIRRIFDHITISYDILNKSVENFYINEDTDKLKSHWTRLFPEFVRSATHLSLWTELAKIVDMIGGIAASVSLVITKHAYKKLAKIMPIMAIHSAKYNTLLNRKINYKEDMPVTAYKRRRELREFERMIVSCREKQDKPCQCEDCCRERSKLTLRNLMNAISLKRHEEREEIKYFEDVVNPNQKYGFGHTNKKRVIFNLRSQTTIAEEDVRETERLTVKNRTSSKLIIKKKPRKIYYMKNYRKGRKRVSISTDDQLFIKSILRKSESDERLEESKTCEEPKTPKEFKTCEEFKVYPKKPLPITNPLKIANEGKDFFRHLKEKAREFKNRLRSHTALPPMKILMQFPVATVNTPKMRLTKNTIKSLTDI